MREIKAGQPPAKAVKRRGVFARGGEKKLAKGILAGRKNEVQEEQETNIWRYHNGWCLKKGSRTKPDGGQKARWGGRAESIITQGAVRRRWEGERVYKGHSKRCGMEVVHGEVGKLRSPALLGKHFVQKGERGKWVSCGAGHKLRLGVKKRDQEGMPLGVRGIDGGKGEKRKNP